MKFEHTSVTNMEGALRGMRNPMNSWSKSDSIFGVELDYQEHEDGSRHVTKCHEICNIGEQDLKLAQRLILAGPEHRKFMRQIFVCVDITAPIFWWKEADQTKVGTVTDSCSTMHKIMESEFTPDMFACEEMRGYKCIVENRPNEIDEDTELWKEYPGDSNYLVSNQGRVKHLSYTNTNGRTMKERILCGSVHNDGYIVISLCLGGSKYKQIPKHRMVAETWLPKVDGKQEVNHKDGNKQNNAVDNLEWCTSSENQQHAIREHLQPSGTMTYRGKLNREQREEIVSKYNSGMFTTRQLAEEYGVSHTSILSVLHNKYNYGDGYQNEFEIFLGYIDALNMLRDEYIITKDTVVWKTLIEMLPSSWLQKRTMTMNYENVRQIVHQRKGHKLSEWHSFIDWARTLPYAEELIFYDGDNTAEVE